MTAKSTKGLQAFMTKGAASPTVLVPTSITKADPAVVTVASAASVLTGDVVYMEDTGFTELDQNSFVVGAVTATTFVLLAMDLTGSTGTLDTSPKATHYEPSDMVLVCLSVLTMNVAEPGTVSTGTFCDPTTSIPSAVVEAGTLTLGGFVDITSPDYQELLNAEDDGEIRTLRVDLPSNGYLIAPMTISTITWDLPLDGAIGYSGTAVLGSKLKHVF